MTERYVINLNDQVTVRMKPRGVELFVAYHERYGIPRDRMPGFTEPNVYRAPLWEICHIFGEHFCMGAPPPVETDLLVEMEGYGRSQAERLAEIEKH